MSLIGLDIGTTGCKAICFTQEGKIVANASREYSILTPKPYWAEQEAEKVWSLAIECLQEISPKIKNDIPIAMSLSVQGEAIIPVDENGNALRNAILGMDTRTTEENEWLDKNIGAEKLFKLTGMPLHTVNTLPKLLWLQQNEPNLWNNAKHFLLYEDFILNKLCGKTVISQCLASRTQMADINTAQWSDEILSKCGINKSKLSVINHDKNGVVGKIKKEVAEKIGLNSEIILASGGHDQACAALGSGIIKSGLAMVSTGTAEVVEVAMDKPVLSESLLKGNISIYRHVVPNLFLAMTLNHCGGILLRWFRDTFCQLETKLAKENGEDTYNQIFSDVTNEPTGLLLLPHFAGSGTPNPDTESKGAILGLTLSTKKSSVAKAILEGLTYELRTNIEFLKSAGIDIAKLHAVGGGAKSNMWLQLKADICKIELNVPQVTEAACLGAAILAGVAAGVYESISDAVNKLVSIDKSINPNKNNSLSYDKFYKLYTNVYKNTIDIQKQL